MGDHALLSASGSERWLTCTPSARYEENFPESTSPYAEEGTAAHLLASATLTEDKEDLAKAQASEYYNQEMQEAADLFCEIVTEKFTEAQERTTDAVLMVEERLDFSDWVPEGFGTGDAVIISDGMIEVIDFKYGQGVPVSAEGNDQLRLYGLGAYGDYGLLYDIRTVKMTIIQPRLDSVSTCELLVEDLLEWAETVVKPKAELAFEGVGDYVPGSHCQFCRGRKLCKTRAEENQKTAKYDFAHPNMLLPEAVADILTRIDELTSWVADVKSYALEQAQKGIKWPGFKLVEGRSNRKYTDTDKVADKLVKSGIEEPLIYKPRELLGITAMEKLLGKKQFTSLLKAYIEKPPGAPTLVPESDKRPEIKTSAQSDFSEK
jgi:hypothetical protein